MDEPVNSSSPLPKPLFADGERFLPGQMHGSIELEHLHRYRFASQLVTDKVVLDIASGEGYGSAYLAKIARRVIGVDIAQEAVDHAKLKYSKDNLEYLTGSCSAIPLENGTVDVVVSFETIEHHCEHETMMQEIKRVLRPGGILIISSPDKLEYSDKPSFHNPFHVKELYKEEFQSLLTAHFKNIHLYGQRVLLGSTLFSQGDKQKIVFNELDSESVPVPNIPMPIYWVAVASDKKLPTTSGGILEQPLANLWREIINQRNPKIAELIRTVAKPDSNLLKAQLSGSWYRQQNPDIVEAGVDPYEHWLNNGMAEGRLPASDLIVLACDLVSEREQSLHVGIEEKEREFRQAQHEFIERQRVLEAESVQAKLRARYEVDAQLRTLTERERAFAEQLSQLQQTASKERAAQIEVTQQQMSALAEQHAQWEQMLRVAIEEKERGFRQVQYESLERQKALETEIVQTRLNARDEVDAQLRTLAERERAFAEQLSQLQQTASKERAAQIEVTQQQMSALAEQHAQREQMLRVAIEEKEREFRQIQYESLERHRVLAVENNQIQLKARYEIETQLRTFAERERGFAEQLSQLQQTASQERVVQIEAARQQAIALAEQYAQRELMLRVAIEENERKLRQVQHDAREREKALELETVTLAEKHARQEQKLRLTIEEKDLELRQIQHDSLERQKALELEIVQVKLTARDQVEAQLNTLVDRERAFAEQLTHLQQTATQERLALENEYFPLLFGLNNKLQAIQSTWGWWLTTPLRSFSELLGTKSDFSPIDPVQFSFVFASKQQLAATVNSQSGSFNSASPGLEKNKQEITPKNSSFSRENIAAAKTFDELFAYDDEAFVTCAYITLLGRTPDPYGYSYYMECLNKFGDKHAIVYQIYRSQEAKNFKCDIAGLDVAMKRQKWKQTPILGTVLGLFDRNSKEDQLLALRKINQNKFLRDVDAQIDTVFKSFDGQKYLDSHPDVLADGINPYEHFMRFGRQEGRQIFATINSPIKKAAGVPPDTNQKASAVDKVNQNQRNESVQYAAHASIQSTSSAITPGASKDITSYFMEPADEILQDDGYIFTRLMHYIWVSRLDLQNIFDIHMHDGRFEFCKWFLCSASNEYGLTPNLYPKNLLERLVSVNGDVSEQAQSMLEAQSGIRDRASEERVVPCPHSGVVGANLIGYAYSEFGLGEHVRMVARSLKTSDSPFCIIDQDVSLHGAGDVSVRHWVTDTPRYDTNIFHVNADIFPFLYFKFGESFFSGRYNIGYWAWELSQCPSEFDVALNMVDEVWSISEFVTESFKTRSSVPVITMPLAVTVPELDTSYYTKAYYGLPEDKFVLFFTFDAASYLDRKNPIAVVRAFKLAFPHSKENVHLLLKTMNIEVAGPLWDELIAEIGNEPRITIMSKRLTREEVLGLNLACDAFVSLHRSEGFGRCVAEAMAYGKPVIVTNYSGTRDFAMEGTACVVNYRLIPVPVGAYPFWNDQVWAEPDIEHAAALMKKLVYDEIYRAEIALAGQKYILENFNESVIGERYTKRLGEIRVMRLSTSTQDISPSQLLVQNMDEMAGNIDAPTVEQSNEIFDVLTVGGWVASIQGVEYVEIYINSARVGQAHYGTLRTDVYSAFPHMAKAARSGFCYQVDTTGLPKGSHTLTVVAKSRSGVIKEWAMNFTLVGSTKYQKWLEKSEQVYNNKEFNRRYKAKNQFSLLLRVKADHDHALLIQTLKSLAAQTHAKFEIVVIADNSQIQMITSFVEKTGLSSKVRFDASASNDWTSKVADCRGQLVGLVDVGDVLRHWALSIVDDVIRTNKKVSLIYGDEDALCEDERCKPIFKPGWSPVFLDHYNYIGRPWFAQKRVMVSALSNLDLGNNDINEHLLLKEIGRVCSSVCHIPSVLVSRHNDSLVEHKQIDSSKWITGNGDEIIYPKVSIIIPTRLSDLDIVDRCFAGLRNLTDYPNMEVIIVANNVADSSLIENYLSKWPFKVLHWNDAFNWSGINNFGMANATGDYLLFMNDDVEPLDKNWLKVMVRTLVDNEAGVVGAHLKYPNGTIQHLGVNFVNYGGGANHLFRFCTGNEHNLQWLMNYPREVSSVTGACLLTTRKCFNTVGGFDETLPLVCNDTDFCIRVLKNGYSPIIQPEAKLIHHEGISRSGMPEVEDVARFLGKWGKYLKSGDQFTNPNLDDTRDDWTVNPDAKVEYRYRISSPIRRK